MTNTPAKTFTELGRQFARLVFDVCAAEPTQDYAATRKSSGKSKQCSKGFACGAGCVSKTKECANPLEGQAKTYAGWLKLQVKAGNKLSQEQQQDADGLGLNQAKTKTKTKVKPKPEEAKAPTPDPGKVSGFQAQTLITKLNAEQEKALAGWNDYYKKIKDDPSIPEAALNRAFEAKGLGADAHYYAKEMPSYADGYRAMTDKNGVTQVMAMTSIKEGKNPSLYVDFLATAPWNVAGDDPRRTKGAGTAMMKALVEESIKRGMEGKVTLYPLDDAIPFYKKLGFSSPNASGDMTLTPKAAYKFLHG